MFLSNWPPHQLLTGGRGDGETGGSPNPVSPRPPVAPSPRLKQKAEKSLTDEHASCHGKRRGGVPRGGGAMDADRVLHAFLAVHPDLRAGGEPRRRQRSARGREALRPGGRD